ETVTFDVRNRRKDGSVFPVEVRLRAITLEGRRYGLALTRDMTDRKIAEDALRQSEQRTRLLLESSGDGIYGIDVLGRCTFINRAGADLLGWPPEALLGRDMHDLAHHSRADGAPYAAADCPIVQAFRAGTPCRVSDEVFWRRDGRAIPVAYSSHPLVEYGEVRGAVVTFTDVTARQAGVAERRQAKGGGGGGGGQPGQERVSGTRQPRDPHAAECHPGHERAGPGHVRHGATEEVPDGDAVFRGSPVAVDRRPAGLLENRGGQTGAGSGAVLAPGGGERRLAFARPARPPQGTRTTGSHRSRRAGRFRRRRRPPPPGADQPSRQRHQVHRRGRGRRQRRIAE